MGLREFALLLKKELKQMPSNEQAAVIADRIKKATINGRPLTEEEINHIICYIQYPGYDHITGIKHLHESDNSEFLKLVAVIQSQVKEKKK